MSLRPTPLRSFLGGVGLSFPVHSLLVFNGSNFGVSGFIHNAITGSLEAASGVAGILLGGLLIGFLERTSPTHIRSSYAQIALSGLLVGVGSKLSNGCTSGHMLCGVSRLSARSLAATASFFVSGAITTLAIHGRNLPVSPPGFDWTPGENGVPLLALKAIFFLMSTALYILPWDERTYHPSEHSNRSYLSVSAKRRIVTFFTGLDFAVALHLSNLTDPNRVLAFLVLPFHRSFDPSLAFLAIGAIPPAMLMYQSYRGSAYFGNKFELPRRTIDSKLVLGAAVFGIGWGLSGVCPAPGLVNLGRVLAVGSDPSQFALWLLGVIIGGRAASI